LKKLILKFLNTPEKITYSGQKYDK
jgi:hypothetical protein